MLEIEESSFSLGLFGKLPSADLISRFGEDCIDLKQQTNSGHGQRVSERGKKSEITAKATITQLKKEHRATVAQLKKEHKAIVTIW